MAWYCRTGLKTAKTLVQSTVVQTSACLTCSTWHRSVAGPHEGGVQASREVPVVPEGVELVQVGLVSRLPGVGLADRSGGHPVFEKKKKTQEQWQCDQAVSALVLVGYFELQVFD